MIRNLSITDKLLKHRDPSLAIKRRFRAIRFPVVTHVMDVVRAGSGHPAQKVVATQFQILLNVGDRSSLRTSLQAGVTTI